MVRGDTYGVVRDRRFRLPIMVVRVHGSVGGAISAGDARADLREHTDLPNFRHNISSDDTAKSVRDY